MDDQLIGLKEVCALVGLSRTQITTEPPRTGMEEFPKPTYIGYRRLYSKREILAWMKAQLDRRPCTSPPKKGDDEPVE